MNRAREQILQRLRQNKDDAAPGIHQRELAQAGPLPALPENLLEQFTNKMKGNAASVDVVTDEQALVDSTQRFLEEYQLPLSLCLVEHAELSDLPWPKAITTEQRMVNANDLTIVSVAEAALAETGSVVMLSKKQTPTEANFLPDNFICIVRQADILGYMEDLWTRLRHQNEGLATTINIISGPSRTADVEQTIQLGAHGPRRMHVIIRQF